MNIGVFLSSRDSSPQNLRAAKMLGKILAQNDKTLVYGGSMAGCMGAVSRHALHNNGKVIAVYPDGILEDEPVRMNATQTIITKTMDERKRKLIDLSEGFIIMPGGYGTMEELMQLMTEIAIGVTKEKPIVLVGEKFFGPILQMFSSMAKLGMVDEESLLKLFIVENDEAGLEQAIHIIEYFEDLKSEALDLINKIRKERGY